MGSLPNLFRCLLWQRHDRLFHLSCYAQPGELHEVCWLLWVDKPKHAERDRDTYAVVRRLSCTVAAPCRAVSSILRLSWSKSFAHVLSKQLCCEYNVMSPCNLELLSL
mmetsp:Transcript_48094/g.79251  ORF Transcript_48094/g.79251 Transcript_48094/m.79251 type:complete len:108 (-) Transcript_48094:136-459(-)